MAFRFNDKTVIRSGYGIFYETGRFKFLDQVTWNSPAYGGTQTPFVRYLQWIRRYRLYAG